jgi:ribonuclease HII
MTLKFGLDDAGRGPVIGPMILAGCIINEEHEAFLRELGVKDSKLLPHKKRLELEGEIKKIAHSYSVRVVEADTISDTHFGGLKLNELEASMCADIINELNILEEELFTILDCPSTNPVAWKNFLKSNIKKNENLLISCEFKADFNHICVACASILAKCERERQMGKIREKFPDCGSGYPSDKKTMGFVEKYAKEHSDKGIFRKNWETYKRFSQKEKQIKLF